MFLEALWCPRFFAGDTNMAPIPFNKTDYEKKGSIKIGYFDTDHWFQPCTASRRAVRETIEKLRDAGHECVPFEPPTDGWFNYRL